MKAVMTHTEASSPYGWFRRGVALIVTTVVAATCSISAPIARGDTWISATVVEVFSASREWFVRVTPGKSFGDLKGFATNTNRTWSAYVEPGRKD